MAVLRNKSDHAILIRWGRNGRQAWLEPDETAEIEDDSVENYNLPGLEGLYEVTPSVPSVTPKPAKPAAPPVQENPE